MEFKEAQELIKKFRDDRDWNKYHNIKDLGIALNNEVAELLDPIKFMSYEEIKNYMNNSDSKRETSHEIADVFMYLVSICNAYDIDLEKSFIEKLKINEERYPVDKSKGRKEKYSEL